jgi:ABC-type proline/glycine betaine transport system ATPase subunit
MLVLHQSIVTHDETEAEVFADKVGIINKKKLPY